MCIALRWILTERLLQVLLLAWGALFGALKSMSSYMDSQAFGSSIWMSSENPIEFASCLFGEGIFEGSRPLPLKPYLLNTMPYARNPKP